MQGEGSAKRAIFPEGPNGSALPRAIGNVNFSALTIGALSLALAALWPRRWSTYLPGPVAALVVGTLLGVLWLHDAPVLGPVPTGVPAFALELPTTAFLLRALKPALILALLLNHHVSGVYSSYALCWVETPAWSAWADTSRSRRATPR